VIALLLPLAALGCAQTSVPLLVGMRVHVPKTTEDRR
jgi:hypothetical protein